MLFTVRLSVLPGATSWSLDVFGDPDFSLYWEPEEQCPPGSPDDCAALQLPVDFLIVAATGTRRWIRVSRGSEVGLDVTTPPVAMPEPNQLLLYSIGTGLLAARLRRRR